MSTFTPSLFSIFVGGLVVLAYLAFPIAALILLIRDVIAYTSSTKHQEGQEQSSKDFTIFSIIKIIIIFIAVAEISFIAPSVYMETMHPAPKIEATPLPMGWAY